MSRYKIMKVSPIALIGILAILPPFAFAQSQEKEVANVRAQAEAKMEAHLNGTDPKVRYAEFRSKRLTKYLPEFRVFVRFDQFRIGESSLFLVNQNAEITDLNNNDQVGISTFLRARKIQVKTPEDVSEFARFFVELKLAPYYVWYLYDNTNDFTVFDKQYIESYSGGKQHSGDADWNYTSEKSEGGWKVTVTYIGDLKNSIMRPPHYEIDIDAQGNFRDLREKNGSGILLEGE